MLGMAWAAGDEAEERQQACERVAHRCDADRRPVEQMLPCARVEMSRQKAEAGTDLGGHGSRPGAAWRPQIEAMLGPEHPGKGIPDGAAGCLLDVSVHHDVLCEEGRLPSRRAAGAPDGQRRLAHGRASIAAGAS